MELCKLKTPCYVIDEKKLIRNLKVLREIEETTGAKILLAQKAFSFFYSYPLIGNYITGVTASGLYEAKLGYEEMKKENHIYSPAYKEEDLMEIDQICDHIIFNSMNQYEKFNKKCVNARIGLRINPQISTQGDHAIYHLTNVTRQVYIRL